MLMKTAMVLSLFGDFSNINIENQDQPSRYASLVNDFLTEGFLIGIFNDVRLEIFPQNTSFPVQKNILRPQLFSSNKEWNIDFFENRIDIKWSAQKISSDMSLDDFIKKSTHYLEIIEKSYKIKFNRIALNSDEALLDFEESMASEIYSCLSNIKIDFYAKEKIKNWWFQFTSVINNTPDISKNINIITGIRRASFDFPWKKQLDAISAHYDINTEMPKQDGKMISPDEKKAFLTEYSKLHEKISKGIFGDIHD